MTWLRRNGKVRRGSEVRGPGARWRNRRTGCAGKACCAGEGLNSARLIGGFGDGQSHQIKRGSSFGGLLNCREVLKKLLRGTTRLNLAALPF
jgi:hypothetical protein